MYEDVIFLNIGIIGGDLRIIRLAEIYAKENNRVYTYGLEKYFDLKSIHSTKDILLLILFLCNIYELLLNGEKITH